jgi:hypothetical protein
MWYTCGPGLEEKVWWHSASNVPFWSTIPFTVGLSVSLLLVLLAFVNTLYREERKVFPV